MKPGVTTGHRERREMGRARLDTAAVVHVGSSELACGTRDLSVKGISLTRATEMPTGTFLRLVLRLPGTSRPIDLDGVLVRTAVEAGSTTWGLEFYEPARHVTEAVARYVAANRCDGPFAQQATRQRQVRLRAKAPIGRAAAKPSFSAAALETAERAEAEADSDTSTDSRLQELYKRALNEPHDEPQRGHWPWLSRRSGP